MYYCEIYSGDINMNMKVHLKAVLREARAEGEDMGELYSLVEDDLKPLFMECLYELKEEQRETS